MDRQRTVLGFEGATPAPLLTWVARVTSDTRDNRIFRASYAASLWLFAVLLLTALAYTAEEPELRHFPWAALQPLAVVPVIYQASRGKPWALAWILIVIGWANLGAIMKGDLFVIMLALIPALFVLQGLLAALCTPSDRPLAMPKPHDLTKGGPTGV